MNIPSKRVLLINGAAVLVMAVGAVAAVRHHVMPPESTPCSERYTRMTRFNLERNGDLVTSAEIQAESAGLDRGVDKNVTIRKLKDGPATAALGVTIDAETGPIKAKNVTGGGVSFAWVPRSLPDKVEASCLSYNVFVGADFEYGRGGTLPGILGIKSNEPLTNANADRFDVHVQWADRGLLRQYMELSTARNSLDLTVPAFNFALPRGRWVHFEQEVVVNTPGQQDGTVRLWVDGKLRLEGRDAELRYLPDVYVAGVTADTYFGGAYIEGVAKKKEQIWFTPFELRWK